VDFVRNQVSQLHHVDVTDDDFLVEWLASASIVKDGLGVLGQLGFF
jgi:hypothetical protein